MKEQKEVNEKCNDFYKQLVKMRNPKHWTLDILTKAAVNLCSPRNKYK